MFTFQAALRWWHTGGRARRSRVQLRRRSASLRRSLSARTGLKGEAPFEMIHGGEMQRGTDPKKKDRRGEKEQYWSRPGCWRAQLMIRDGKINSGRNEKDWFGSETIKKKWRQEQVWGGWGWGGGRKMTEQEIRGAATILQRWTSSSNFPIVLYLIDSTRLSFWFLSHCHCCWDVPSFNLLINKKF